MAQYQILYWKHVPSQIKVFDEGKRPLSRQLPGRLAEIDQIAMEQGLTGTDDYLSHWQWTPKQERDGSAEAVADELLKELTPQPKVDGNTTDPV
jgi:hypothetical protein